jgi:hypothetical protein
MPNVCLKPLQHGRDLNTLSTSEPDDSLIFNTSLVSIALKPVGKFIGFENTLFFSRDAYSLSIASFLVNAASTRKHVQLLHLLAEVSA